MVSDTLLLHNPLATLETWNQGKVWMGNIIFYISTTFMGVNLI